MTEKETETLQKLFNRLVKEEAKSMPKIIGVNNIDEAIHEVAETLSQRFYNSEEEREQKKTS